MGKVNRERITNKRSDGLLRKLFTKPLRERCCKACGRPHVGQIEPLPAERIWLGNAEVQVFDSKPYGRFKRELKIQCWNRYPDGWHSQSVFTLDDLKNLAVVIDHTLRLMQEDEHSSKNVRLQ